MRQPGQLGPAGPLYTTVDQHPGPCYVLCPRRWRKGERFVLATLQPAITSTLSVSTLTYSGPTQIGTRRIVTWPEGKPLEWRTVAVPIYRPAPAWHAVARRLKAQGLSYRAIASEVGKDVKVVHSILKC